MRDPADMDREANIFTAYLLMPPELFDPLMKNGPDLNDDQWIAKVARRFRVPIAAVVWRVMLWGQEAR